ncbi:3-oxo-tetronate kinase [Mesorhizobium sp.]|uniref:3-oxo-tetronate kinase n=1 Tax=Mesorhizobium sp. TaxID=1871066 RepID=UPI000FEAA8FB|nr:3-oxo-tetronate kinase [Mesorhizobium sp.]RWG04153.1 MAG: four-carbon acid sugar kinase family protein [Mesorhizobium sp.]RWH01150.1 MAG: four-carbon acid sugar kinase family protein [Mesorhizobium sp.]RWI16633.1 MAG: four-carbon acid sugar kinase family protein [Mesorhizobium sp.]RWN07702.1 MAG: four-carbon acid sugar kinase family protein [Mesorhizobium sp.]RWN12380.1 MAG: four-carbon acid sugar kinase family protein [Mesorhizobium sp.]
MAATSRLNVGCVADDFTGATDVAGIFAKSGMKTTVMIGAPSDRQEVDADAIVVALKTRTIEPSEAVRQSLHAFDWLRRRGALRFYFKYCSTFDSTDRGNIGPVLDAMLDALGSEFTIACPAFPANARTVYKSNLFVGDLPLSESGMRDHPLTPMTDSNLVRVLAPQTRRKVGPCYHETVKGGVDAMRTWSAQARATGVGVGVIDAMDDIDLENIARAFADIPLLTGASGLAHGLARLLFKGGAPSNAARESNNAHAGYRAVISGSCSSATNGQVERMLQDHEGYRIDLGRLADGQDLVADALEWAKKRLGAKPVLIYATAAPNEVKANQAKYGSMRAGDMVETALARIAKELVTRGVSQLIVAGGETSGAVVKSLGISQLDIGNEIAPGVPWVSAPTGAGPISLALKSGNFGGKDFFIDAWSKI